MLCLFSTSFISFFYRPSCCSCWYEANWPLFGDHLYHRKSLRFVCPPPCPCCSHLFPNRHIITHCHPWSVPTCVCGRNLSPSTIAHTDMTAASALRRRGARGGLPVAVIKPSQAAWRINWGQGRTRDSRPPVETGTPPGDEKKIQGKAHTNGHSITVADERGCWGCWVDLIHFAVSIHPTSKSKHPIE